MSFMYLFSSNEADLQKNPARQHDIDHLKEHIAEGEALLQQIKSMKLH